MQELLNKHVMIRTETAGVHFGTLASAEYTLAGIVVKLTNATRIWSWTGALSLSELAAQGSTKKDSKFSVEVPSIYLNAIEVIEMTDKGWDNLKSIPVFVPA